VAGFIEEESMGVVVLVDEEGEYCVVIGMEMSLELVEWRSRLRE
jgi:hypothetical protein